MIVSVHSQHPQKGRLCLLTSGVWHLAGGCTPHSAPGLFLSPNMG